MNLQFTFATAGRIVFGDGSLERMFPEIAGMGRRAFILTGRAPGRAEPLVRFLRRQRVAVETFPVHGEPTTDSVMEAAGAARAMKADIVVSVGGGSVIDAGKAVAALAANPGPVTDYLEVIGEGKPLASPPAPCIAVPTTAGTGSEVTKNAVVKSTRHGVKVSMRDVHMIPNIAIVDPLLTHTMPPEVTASTGMDALTQLIEPFVSDRSNPLTDGLCREGIRRAARSFKAAFQDGTDGHARADMALASLFGGLALANAKLGAVHGIAGPMGGMIPAPHGVACARLLAPVMEANVRALQDRDPKSPLLVRFHETGRMLTGDPGAGAMDAVRWIRNLTGFLSLPRLSDFGLTREMFPDLIAKSRRASSMKGNPVRLEEAELEDVLLAAL